MHVIEYPLIKIEEAISEEEYEDEKKRLFRRWENCRVVNRQPRCPDCKSSMRLKESITFLKVEIDPDTGKINPVGQYETLKDIWECINMDCQTALPDVSPKGVLVAEEQQEEPSDPIIIEINSNRQIKLG